MYGIVGWGLLGLSAALGTALVAPLRRSLCIAADLGVQGVSASPSSSFKHPPGSLNDIERNAQVETKQCQSVD